MPLSSVVNVQRNLRRERQVAAYPGHPYFSTGLIQNGNGGIERGPMLWASREIPKRVFPAGGMKQGSRSDGGILFGAEAGNLTK